MWHNDGSTLKRTFDFKGFKNSLSFVKSVADLAEQLHHHPDILIQWNKVTLSLSTHDAGDITEKDFQLADLIDELFLKC
jgi:4a-hydroxytetrahydrobiopterin dehydratase